MGRPDEPGHYEGKPLRRWLAAGVKAFLTVAAVFMIYRQWPNSISKLELSYAELQDLLLNVPCPHKTREWSSYYVWGSHFPGEGFDQAQWTKTKWSEFGLQDIEITQHSVYLPRLKDQRVALLDLNETHNQVVHEVSLLEDTAPPGSAERPFIPAFFAWSANGNVTAEYVYANFGLDQDYEELLQRGISVKGKIVIIKLTFNSPLLERLNATASRFNQIVSATKAGAIGVLAYTDTQGDEPYTEANGYLPLPDGPARPPSMIQRGTIGLIESSPNDADFRAHLPQIPAVPISYADAAQLLRALNNRGPNASELSERWWGGGLGYRGVQYNVGPSARGMVINLHCDSEIEVGQVHNVLGTIEGSIKDEIILLGNHRDTWGPGAGDSHSGSSALNEVVRALGTALQRGWKPLRTIVFASWEGEEVGRVGSRSWLQENTQKANTTISAYLNVVEAAAGQNFHVQASPLLSRAILAAAGRVLSPNQTVSGQTVLDVWGGDVRFGTAGDSILFQGCACLPSSDFGFLAGPGEPVFPYHSLYDTLEYMDKFGDPTWEYHTATAKMWGSLAAHLSETPVLAFNVTDYAIAMKKAANYLERLLSDHDTSNLDSLQEAIDTLFEAAIVQDSRGASLLAKTLAGPTPSKLQAEIRAVNRKYMAFERVFCRDIDRLTKDSNHLFVPSTPYYVHKSGFPTLEKAIQEVNSSFIQIERDLLVERIGRATEILRKDGSVIDSVQS